MTEEKPPSEQRGGTTPDEAEIREKGGWVEHADEGVVPPELGGSDAPREMLDEDPEMHSGVLGRTTGSDEPATESGIDLSAGDQADATTDGGNGSPHRARSPTPRTSAPRPASPTPTTLPSHAFAEAAARDGIALESRAFDWLCEQGHVGLERVAKARRDPAIVAPVIAALEVLAAIYARLKGDVSVLHASRENLFLPVDLVHPPTGTVIAVDGREHFTSFRLTALDSIRRTRRSGSTSRSTASCAARCRRRPTGCRAGSPRRASASAACRASAPTTTRCLDLAAPAMGHPPVVRIAAVDGDGEAAYARHRAALLSLAG